LDEPTSALDSNSEHELNKALSQLLQQKTVILASHRRSLLELMDVVYVLQDGVLRDVKEFGGLDTYLAKVNDIESQISTQQTKLEEAQLLEKIQRDRQQALVQELSQKNAQLQQKISSTSQVTDNAASLSDDGVTLTISH
jgi:ABC-type multidrug transport system ATPase subunit